MNVKEILSQIPKSPGVYFYRNDKDDLIGFELTLSHGDDFSITMNEGSFASNYSTLGNETKVVIIMENGSELFSTVGDYEIVEVLVGVVTGELFNVTIVDVPTEFTLSQAYPNPFNPTTTINFSIPADTQVSIAVYNLQGREVVSLASGSYDAGYHQVIWNADTHSSGVYFVKMVAGSYVNTQKLMLVK